MCKSKKLCTCGDEIPEDNNWKLEVIGKALEDTVNTFGTVLPPEAREELFVSFKGDEPMVPQFLGRYIPKGSESSLRDINTTYGNYIVNEDPICLPQTTVTEEVDDLLAQENPFDFDYTPKAGDKLTINTRGFTIKATHNGSKWVRKNNANPKR